VRVLGWIGLGLLVALAATLWWLWAPDKARGPLEARYAAPPSRFLEVQGVRFHLRDTGPRDAPAVLLLHGFGSSLHTWEDWAELLEEARRVVRLDLPGFGLTGPDPTRDYSDDRAVALLAGLLDELGLGRVDLVGSSMGGRIAWRFAAARPERVRRLVLMAPDGFASLGREYGEAPRVPAVMRLLPYTLPAPLVRATLEPAYASPAALRPEVLERYRDMLLAPGIRQAILDRTADTVLVPPEPLLRLIAAPVLLLWGEADRMVPASHAADYERLLPDSRTVVLPGLGHVPMEEDPARALAPLRAFLETPDGSGTARTPRRQAHNHTFIFVAQNGTLSCNMSGLGARLAAWFRAAPEPGRHGFAEGQARLAADPAPPAMALSARPRPTAGAPQGRVEAPFPSTGPHGHRHRMRVKLLERGPDALADYELLEMLLFFAMPKGDTKPLAKALVNRFGSFASVLAAPRDVLLATRGLGEHSVAAIKLVQAAAQRLARAELMDAPVLNNTERLDAYLTSVMARETVEQFRVLFLDPKNRLIADEVQGRGTVNHTPVYAREVVKRALELHSTALILVHNHPSGDPTPSRGDVEMTGEVKAAAALFGIVLHDHIVVGRGRHFSFRQEGMLPRG
jgi:DNA repair protein RadC